MTLGVAILGSGLAAEIHSKTLRAVAPAVRRWYASRDAARAGAIASRWKGAGHFGGYEAALASRDIDAVIIAVPPSFHLEWTRRALEAGKHVIVEKPPFLTTVELDEAGAAATRAGRQLMVAENYFYKPLTQLLKTTIRQGDLGSVLFIQLNALKEQHTTGWRDDEKLTGGGALFEGGIHWVSLLANIGLTPVRSRASFPFTAGRPGEAGRAGRPGKAGTEGGPDQTARAGAANGVGGAAGREERAPRSSDRSAVVTIDYAEGAVATLSYSWDVPALINGMRISRVYGTSGVLRFETNGLVALLAGKRRRLFFPGVFDLAGYRAMMTDFIGAIEQSRPPAYNLTLARRDLHLIEGAYASTSGSLQT